MNHKTGDEAVREPSAREQLLRTREKVVAARETTVRKRERVSATLEEVLTEREMIARLQEDAANARAEADHAQADRDLLLVQIRAANEHLVLATLRADALSDDAEMSRVISVESTRLANEGKERAEALARELIASNEALRLSETQFVTLANTVPMLAWYAEPTGEIGWYNQRWYDYTGTDRDTHDESMWSAAHDASDLPRVTAGWRACLETGEQWEDVFRLRRHDGEMRWFLTRASPLRNASGEIVRWFGTTVDIDDQKRAEAVVTASLRAKDEFLAMLGHELRNPIAPIRTALDLMTMRDPTRFERERTIIDRQVSHLVRLIDDLLDISRITGGKIELRREVVELHDLVSLAVETASPLLEEKSHHLTIAVGPGLLVDVDVTRMTQVLSNLVANAAKYTPAQGTIEILGERRGSSIWLGIRDNGIGISAAMLPHVFDLFAQESQAIDRPAGGLGLGLAIVKSLVAMHGGTVTATSPGLGRGSQFELGLPESTRAMDASVDRFPVTGRVPTIVPAKVLVVDDNLDAGELIGMSLAARGHEVRVAIDAPTALAIVSDFTPQIVLTDIDLPVIDGYELAELLRASLIPSVTQFVAITGYGQPDARKRSEAAGFALHLVKPVSISRLDQGIRELVRVVADQALR